MVDAVTPPNPSDLSDKNRTIPDPTLLTIDSIRREITMMADLVEAGFIAAEDLNKERFHSVDQLMERSEEQRKEQKSDTKAAVDAALDSQKEATAKMEKSISDQIDALRRNFETSMRSISQNADGLKERLTILESVKQGQSEQKTEQRSITQGQLALLGAAITVGIIVVNVILFLLPNGFGN